jgi:hypothetical protein
MTNSSVCFEVGGTITWESVGMTLGQQVQTGLRARDAFCERNCDVHTRLTRARKWRAWHGVCTRLTRARKWRAWHGV